ncbi:MAG: radical SAM protein [Spirochaetes bacterium]|nr:radical SAM protein [Spirochaetota bacterium]
MINKILKNTESVCPVCLKRIPARKLIEDQNVYLIKECPEHGNFRVLIWQSGIDYNSWEIPKISSIVHNCKTGIEYGCPFDCGICPDHRQEGCCILLEITSNCNLRCPICFANSNLNKNKDPEFSLIESWYRQLFNSGIPYNIQLSGGEPTTRDDLPEIIRLGHEIGFDYIQLNTNGLSLGKEPDYVRKLGDAGLNSVFLQFDGTTDEIYKTIRGAPLLDVKMAAIDNCSDNNIGVVLVPTLVREINLNNIGDIIRLAAKRIPHVRGVHFQPISFFGRYPSKPPMNRITIPEIIKAIEYQTEGRLKTTNFRPAGAENSYCSFHGNFILMQDGTLKPLPSSQRPDCCTQPVIAAEEIIKSRQFVAKQWSVGRACCCKNTGMNRPEIKDAFSDYGMNTESLDDFLDHINSYSLVISGMAFMDAWNMDLDRLRDCKIHVFHPDGRLIPFCAFNLTSESGKSIYRTMY